MRRVVVVAVVALAVALGSASARAAVLHAGPFDFGPRLMLSLFGETSDASATFAAQRGDRASESPLRDLAFDVSRAGAASYVAAGASAAPVEERLSLRDLAIDQGSSFAAAPPSQERAVRFSLSAPPQRDLVSLVAPGEHFTAAYQPVQPDAIVSPAPGTLAFVPPQIHAEGFVPTAQLGAVRFESHDDGALAAAVRGALRDTSYGAGANFGIRAGRRRVNLDLSSEYEHVGRDDSLTFSVAAPGSTVPWQVPGTGAPLLLPNDADLSRLSLGAGVSVPVVRGLTLNLNYGAQRLYGAYGLPGLVNLDAVNDSYGGKLTYDIPQISSSFSISAQQDRFQNSLLPANASTQTREDFNFTVKF